MPALAHAGKVLADPPSTTAKRRRWLEARRNGLGASEVSTILGINPYGDTPLGVWLDKTATTPPDLGAASEAMEWGLRLERPVIDAFRTRYSRGLGLKVAPSPGLLAHEHLPMLLATPDRLGVSRDTGDVICPIEAKTAGHFAQRDWSDGVPLHYRVQTQVQMDVLDLSHAYVIPLFAGQRMPEPYRVERDDEVIELIHDEVSAWWERHIIGGEPPDPTEADLPRLAELYPGDVDAAAVASPEVVRRLELRSSMKARIAALESAIARIDVDVKQRMGDATTLLDEDGATLATWKRDGTRRSVDVKRLRLEQPDVARRYTVEQPTQRFTVK